MLLYSGHSFPASDHGCWAEYTTAVSSVSSTDSASNSGKKLCCYTQGTPSQPQPQAQPQTMVVGQSIPQQYPQSPAQTVPPTQVRNYVVILGALLPSLSPRPSLRPWLLDRAVHSYQGSWRAILSVTTHINCIVARCLINVVYLMACAIIRSC